MRFSRLRFLLSLVTLLAAAQAMAGSPKVLLYHHVSDETPGSTSVSPATFEAHLQLIKEEGYEVVPVSRIVDALVNGSEMDSRWVAITFDDAYESVGSTAAPMLAERGWPFTVFISTDFVDDGYGLYLSWDALRRRWT